MRKLLAILSLHACFKKANTNNINQVRIKKSKKLLFDETFSPVVKLRNLWIDMRISQW